MQFDPQRHFVRLATAIAVSEIAWNKFRDKVSALSTDRMEIEIEPGSCEHAAAQKYAAWPNAPFIVACVEFTEDDCAYGALIWDNMAEADRHSGHVEFSLCDLLEFVSE